MTEFTGFVPFIISCPNCGNCHQTKEEMAVCLTTIRKTDTIDNSEEKYE